LPQIGTPNIFRRIRRVQAITIAWMSVEAVVSLFAAWRARSSALLAFDGDSAIELFSAVVVLWRFRAGAEHEEAERRATRVAGALLFALATYVAVASVASLLGYNEAKPSLLGIAISVAAATIMPWLAKEKPRLSGFTGSAALRADAAQSALCAYLLLIAWAGLAINTIWHVKWADPVAALPISRSFYSKAGRRYEANPATAAEIVKFGLLPKRETQPRAIVVLPGHMSS
jgi:divalent metal cation (Fe/Co/Zn/Cd) transporter